MRDSLEVVSHLFFALDSSFNSDGEIQVESINDYIEDGLIRTDEDSSLRLAG